VTSTPTSTPTTLTNITLSFNYSLGFGSITWCDKTLSELSQSTCDAVAASYQVQSYYGTSISVGTQFAGSQALSQCWVTNSNYPFNPLWTGGTTEYIIETDNTGVVTRYESFIVCNDATPTPTPTISETPTNTPTPSLTATPSLTPTLTPTSTILPANPSLVLDFDASVATNFTPTAVDGNVTLHWNNLVSGGQPFTGNTSLFSPVWEILPSYNNLGSLEFTTDKSLTVNLEDNFDFVTGYTLFFLFNSSNVSTLQYVLRSTETNLSTNDEKIFIFTDSGANLEVQYLNSNTTRQYSGWTTDVSLVTVAFNGSLTDVDRLKVRINGADVSPVYSNGVWPTSISTGGLELGSGNPDFFGNVGALKLYNYVIDVSTITSVENELMTKFGITPNVTPTLTPTQTPSATPTNTPTPTTTPTPTPSTSTIV
jgi:hypothetical protein